MTAPQTTEVKALCDCTSWPFCACPIMRDGVRDDRVARRDITKHPLSYVAQGPLCLPTEQEIEHAAARKICLALSNVHPNRRRHVLEQVKNGKI